MKTIIVGYDGSSESELALERAAEFARAFSAELVVTSVLRPFATPAPVLPLGGVALPPAGIEELGAVELDAMPEVDAEWLEHLAAVEERLAGQGVRVATVSCVGWPIDRLIEVADERGADLIVVGTHEPGLLERIVRRSTSQAVARRAHCDVLVVHPEIRSTVTSASDPAQSSMAEEGGA